MPRSLRRSAVPAAVAAVFAAWTAGHARAEPAPTAGEGDHLGVLRFAVLNGAGEPIPSRITFIAQDGSRPALFTNPAAKPDDLAVRHNAVYTLSGGGEITVPPGAYTVIASRGMEHGIDEQPIEVRAGETTTARFRVEREIDTTGWISGDYHLHTLTHSGHGDANMPERVISLVGEGLEFAVATDHNHNTDYAPTMKDLGATLLMSAVVGNEVSTPVGHFNAFPLNPSAPLVRWRVPSAVPLFRMIRDEANAWGITPVIQVNHPRWGTINYFGQAGLDPLTGASDSGVWSEDFDTVEVFNENECWGYYDPDETDLPVSDNSHSVMRDWYNLLNRGMTIAAVGNSDSHDVVSEVPAIPRNYTPSRTDDPAAIDAAEVAQMLRDSRVFTTTGPFVEFSVSGTAMGGTASLDPASRTAAVEVRVQAARWIDVARVKIVVNGEVVRTIDVPESRSAVRLETAVPVALVHDAWVCVLAEGDEPMSPVMHDQGRPILPLAVTNPVWVDADGDGAWTAPWARIDAAVRGLVDAGSPLDATALATMPAADRAMMIHASAARGAAFAGDLALAGLRDEDRFVRLNAARACRVLGAGTLDAALAEAAETAGDDGLLSMELLMARGACAGRDLSADVLAMLADGRSEVARRFAPELSTLVRGRFVPEWMFAGFFDCPEQETLRTARFGPETDPAAERTFAVRGGEAAWRPISADATGYVDLTVMAPDDCERAAACLQAWIISPDAREVTYTLGSDDSGMLWINDALIYEAITSRGADPLQHVGTVTLRRGPNRVLFKVHNGGGPTGVYFRVIDEAVSFSAVRP